METNQPILSLRVINSNILQSGRIASHQFDLDGGTIGSSDTATWSIQDQSAQIEPIHLAVIWRDNAFCLITSSLVRINHADIVGKNAYIKLQQGDMIQLGDLQLRCHIRYDITENNDPLAITPEALVSSRNPLEEMLAEKNKHPSFAFNELSASAVRSGFSQDPLKVLQTNQITTSTPSFSMSSDAASFLQQDHYQGVNVNSPISDDETKHGINVDFIDLPSVGEHSDLAKRDPIMGNKQYLDSSVEQQYIAISPLMRALNAALPLANSQDSINFLEEIGHTLQAAIKGLLALQDFQGGLSDKQLRPLEDNPLRLGLDYTTTLHVLFGEQKSPVHLSAPAAVSESLQNLHTHYEANKVAINQALSAILMAFSPQSLLARFANYRRSYERENIDSAWAWDMYCSYYQELSSSRQQGFEKLFNEVYEQAYDHALRSRKQEKIG